MKNIKSTLLLAMLLAGSVNLFAAKVEDLVPISKSWVFVADDIIDSTGLTSNTLYADNHIFSPAGNSYANNKGKSTFGGGEHLNCLRLKNAQNRLAFKVADACTITFYGQSHNSRGVILSSQDNVTNKDSIYVIAYQKTDSTKFTAEITNAGTYYLTSYEGDIFLAGFVVEMALSDNTPRTVTFANDTEEVIGTLPVAVDVEVGATLTIPANRTLFKEGYTLTGWSDGTKTYAIGESFEPQEDITLKPIFTANTYTLAQSLSDLTVRWDFQRQNGAPQVQWEQRTGDFLVTQVAINGQTTDVKLAINTTPGKFANAGWEDWCQVNEGTTFSFPAIEGSTVKALSMSEPKNSSSEKSTVDGSEYSAYDSYIATYATAPVNGYSTMLVKGGSYYRYIEITYPADESELPLKALTVDGVAMDGAVLAAINAAPNYEATFSDNIYTVLPEVKATLAGGSDVEGVPSGDGTTRTYTIKDEANSITFTLHIEGVHIYAPTGDEGAVDIKYNEGTVTDNVWTNGVYTFTTSGISSSGGADFKFDANTDASYTISIPADIAVKQFIIKNFHANYSGGNGQLKTVTSEGATTYLPTRRTALCNITNSTADNRLYEGEAYDLVVTIENHAAGTPIVFTMLKSAQPMGWIQLTTVKVAPTTAPVKTAESVTIDDNHAVVAVTFDREIVNEVSASIADKTVTAQGGSSTLYFPIWDLEYASNNMLTIAAGAVKDAYDNTTDAAIEVAVNIPAKEAVVPAEYDYVVSTTEEFLDAIEKIRSTNENNVNAARKIIFLKNGEYDLGSTGETTVLWVRAHNLSLIGESRDGVIIHGYSYGISNPVLNLRNWQGYYLQDLTVRNDFDYGTGKFEGVAVAVYGGDKTIMKNVRLLSNQDTQVTGDRAYMEDCAIHGTVDFICGGGDNFYYHTDLVLENRSGNVIAAPSTSAASKWGYVFDHCTIKAADDATAVTAGSYSLGRPWQNEPRIAFLHTTMEVVCSDAGWAGMSEILPTHFYEYGSVDSEGSAVNTNGRKNSSTSSNEYDPILTADSAAHFTARNVLGGTDAWDAASKAAQVSAPTVALNQTTLSWNAVEDALLYVVFKDGEYVANITTTSYSLGASGNYTVKAANRFGGLGAASNTVTYKATATGCESATGDTVPTVRKVFRDGQLIIVRDGKEYNALGGLVK